MKNLLLALMFGGFASQPAAAQISWQPNFNMVANINNAVVLNPCAYDDCKDDKAKPQKTQPAAQRPAALATLAQLNFVPSPALRKRNFATFVDKMRPGNPAGAEQMAKMFASSDLIDQVGKSIAPTGLRTNNVADAFALWWATTWSASRGKADDKTRAQMQSVRALVVKVMLTDPGVSRATAAQKQEFAEGLFIQSLLLDTAVKQARGNQGNLALLARTARQAAQAAGLNLDVMNLTANGFVPVDQR